MRIWTPTTSRPLPAALRTRFVSTIAAASTSAAGRTDLSSLETSTSSPRPGRVSEFGASPTSQNADRTYTCRLCVSGSGGASQYEYTNRSTSTGGKKPSSKASSTRLSSGSRRSVSNPPWSYVPLPNSWPPRASGSKSSSKAARQCASVSHTTTRRLPCMRARKRAETNARTRFEMPFSK